MFNYSVMPITELPMQVLVLQMELLMRQPPHHRLTQPMQLDPVSLEHQEAHLMDSEKGVVLTVVEVCAKVSELFYLLLNWAYKLTLKKLN